MSQVFLSLLFIFFVFNTSWLQFSFHSSYSSHPNSLLPKIPFFCVSIHKWVVLLEISIWNNITRSHKTRHKPLYESWVWQPNRRKKDLRADESETSLFLLLEVPLKYQANNHNYIYKILHRSMKALWLPLHSR